jgi:CRISPR-associated protein Cmr3
MTSIDDKVHAEWQGFRANPDDVLFFRDSKPATVNFDHYFRSLFPPLPSTLYGMIRTARLCDRGVSLEGLNETRWKALPPELRAEIGEWGQIGSLRMRGPWLVRNQDETDREAEILLPAPADLGLILTDDDSAPRDVVRYLPVDGDGGRRNWSHGLKLMQPHLHVSPGGWRVWTARSGQPEPTAADGWFVKCSGMERWLSGGTPAAADLVRPADLWSVERRIGIGLETSARTAKKSQLFSFGYVRLRRGVGIGFEIQGCDLNPSRIAWLGGEGRVVHIERGPSLSARFTAAPSSSPFRSSLYLATPAVFNTPDASAPANPCPYAAVVRSSLHIGGWDLVRRGPKPLRRGVAAGSVYYVEAGDSAIRSYVPISDMHEQGFGLTLAGTVPKGES